MKIDRLLGILTVLLRNEQVTAPMLAKRFEVSRRTINRDVEDLCIAGIPIVTLQGSGGGIRIADGYKIDKTLFTTQEMQTIMTGLRSIDSIDDSGTYENLIDKLFPESKSEADSVYDESKSIIIDLTSYYKGRLAPKIRMLKEAIFKCRRVSFDYYAPTGDTKREIEPYTILFQWSNWYIYGYCLERNDYRLFKLNRLTNLVVTEKVFVKRDTPEINCEDNDEKKYHFIGDFDLSCKWRLVEEYGIDSFYETKGGKLHMEVDFSDINSMMCWVFGFEDKVRVYEPKEFRELYFQKVRNILSTEMKTDQEKLK